VDVTRANSEFMKKFKAMTGGDDTYYSEATYTLLLVLVNAWEKTPAADGQKPPIDDVIKTMRANTAGLDSPLGKLNMNSNGNIMMSPILMTVKNGAPVLAEE
jgi:ABC-type branched-subunit amino acid transport system substrate-binding protein